jgi:acyl-[acyl carrier protein]--UDP-N-acetylglucosamine O-acyltransferase
MTTQEIYAIKPDENGWRVLPNGNYVKLGNYVTLGDGVTLGNDVKLGNCVKLGDDVTLGNCVRLGDDVKLGNCVKLGNFVTLGNCVKLGNGVTLGEYVKLGDHVKLGNYVTSACSIHSAYLYTCSPQITKDKSQFIQMGCFLRSREAWKKDFWNNPNEFPNDGSKKSKDRLTAFKMACVWLDGNS